MEKVKAVLDLDMVKNARDVFNLIRTCPRKRITMKIPVGEVHDNLQIPTDIYLRFEKYDISNDPYAIGLSINKYKHNSPKYKICIRFCITFNCWDDSSKNKKYNRIILVDYIFNRTENYAEIDWYDKILEGISDTLRENIKKYNNDRIEITTKGEKWWKEGKDNENDSNN